MRPCSAQIAPLPVNRGTIYTDTFTSPAISMATGPEWLPGAKVREGLGGNKFHRSLDWSPERQTVFRGVPVFFFIFLTPSFFWAPVAATYHGFAGRGGLFVARLAPPVVAPEPLRTESKFDFSNYLF